MPVLFLPSLLSSAGQELPDRRTYKPVVLFHFFSDNPQQEHESRFMVSRVVLLVSMGVTEHGKALVEFKRSYLTKLNLGVARSCS